MTMIGHLSPIEQQVADMISPSLEDMGYSIVRVRLAEGHGKRSLNLQIMIDRKDGQSLTVDDCEDASHQISALLDVEDPIKSEYDLEISSAGIDRPLTRLKDFIEYTGYEAKITSEPVDGRKRFRGILKGVKENRVCIEVDGVEFAIEAQLITSAKLVLTDALIKRGH